MLEIRKMNRLAFSRNGASNAFRRNRRHDLEAVLGEFGVLVCGHGEGRKNNNNRQVPICSTYDKNALVQQYQAIKRRPKLSLKYVSHSLHRANNRRNHNQQPQILHTKGGAGLHCPHLKEICKVAFLHSQTTRLHLGNRRSPARLGCRAKSECDVSGSARSWPAAIDMFSPDGW
jgi:hypothetical protein